jgi:hypothetical protein
MQREQNEICESEAKIKTQSFDSVSSNPLKSFTGEIPFVTACLALKA